MRWALMRQSVLRRLTAVIGRLDPEGAAPVHADGPPGDLSTALSRLEETASRSVDRLAEAEDATRRLLSAFGHLAQGVVVSDRQGVVVYRNPQAAMFVGARHGEALAERALVQLLTAAVA